MIFRLNWKILLHWLGSALGFTGVFFVGLRLYEYWNGIDHSRFDTATWSFVLVLAFVYGASGLFLASAWKSILKHLGVPTSFIWSAKVYGVSQLGKYLPGNIFHFAGRQALGMSANISAVTLVRSSVWELGLICTAGATFSILVIPIYINDLTNIYFAIFWLAAVGGSAFFLGIKWDREIRNAFLLQIIFLGISGFVFTILLGVFSDATFIRNSGVLVFIGAYVVAWLAGLATPGAPAGMGVREMVLIFLLGRSVPESELLPVVILSRFVTVAGDALFFSVMTGLLKYPTRHYSILNSSDNERN
jgi:hypothetical protein